MDYSNLTKEQIINGIRNSSINSAGFVSLNEKFRIDRDIVLEVVKKDGWMLSYCIDSLQDDKEIVLEAVKNNGLVMGFVSERLQDNKEILLHAVKNNMFSLLYASERLQDDKDLLELLEKNENGVSYFNDKDWYEERMEFLNNIRDKELMEKAINSKNILSKKIKF